MTTTQPGDERPDIDEARRLVEESKQRADAERRRARESARGTWSLARRLRRLREENGFDRIMDEAYGGSGG